VEFENSTENKDFYLVGIRDKILIIDVLLHRGWTGSLCYVFCSTYESIDHLFILCDISFTWSRFNKHNTREFFLILGTFRNCGTQFWPFQLRTGFIFNL
jgi:hypothetical protein